MSLTVLPGEKDQQFPTMAGVCITNDDKGMVLYVCKA
jgi:hypothetical protein